jgi:hypothetical protein
MSTNAESMYGGLAATIRNFTEHWHSIGQSGMAVDRTQWQRRLHDAATAVG